MSLVNNMLRDLDQRRKGHTASPTTVNLTPVAETRERRQLHLLIGLAAVVAVLAATSGVYYFRLTDQGATVENLNLRPDLAAPANNVVVLETTPSPIIGSETVAADTAELTNAAAAPAPASEPVSSPVAVAAVDVGSAVPLATAPAAVEQSAILSTRQDEPAPSLPPIVETASLAADIIAPTPAVTELTSNPAPGAGSSAAESAGQEASALIRNSTELSPQERDSQNVQNALMLFNSNQVNASFMMLSDYLRNNGDAHQTRETYAKLLLSQGALSEANRVVDEGLAIAPNRAGFKKVKARLLLTENQPQQAIALLTNRAPAIEGDIEYHDLLATAQMSGRDYTSAVTTYTALIRQDNREGKWWYGIGAAYDGLGDATSAIQAYNQALQSSNLSSSLRQRSQRRIIELRQ